MYLFKQSLKPHDPHSAGYTLHRLRHSGLTHLAAKGRSAAKGRRPSRATGTSYAERAEMLLAIVRGKDAVVTAEQAIRFAPNWADGYQALARACPPSTGTPTPAFRGR